MNILLTIRRLAWLVWIPSKAFSDIRQQPTWLGVLLVIGVTSCILNGFSFSAFYQVGLLPDYGASLDIEVVKLLTSYQKIIYVTAIILIIPIYVIIWSFSAFLIWLVIQVFSGLCSFRSIYSMIAHLSIVTVVPYVIVTAIIIYKYQTGILEYEDMNIDISLNVFLKPRTDSIINVLLGLVSPFSLWYYILLTIGLKEIAGLNVIKAVAVVSIFASIVVGFTVGGKVITDALIPSEDCPTCPLSF